MHGHSIMEFARMTKPVVASTKKAVVRKPTASAGKLKAPATSKRAKLSKLTTSVSHETQTLGLAKLESSGLTAEDFDLLGLELLDGIFTRGLHESFKPLPAIRINYYCPATGAPLAPWPKWPAFYRLRYLKEEAGFNKLTDKKPLRYVQEPNSGVCAYFPRNVEWASIVQDPLRPIIITEGEFKAAKACKEGYPTIGLGGVHNWRSSNLALPFLTELEAVNWVKRNVYLIFDSDLKTNENIVHALNGLAEELMKRGALPHLVVLPDVKEDGKTGLDDYLVMRDPETLRHLLHDRAQPLTLAQPLMRLNKEVVYVCNPGIVMIEETSTKLSPNAFKDHVYAALDAAEQVVKPDGSVSMRAASASALWLKWPLRRQVSMLTYAPGKPRYLDLDVVHKSAINIWPGWGVQPAKGDVAPFLKLTKHLFTGAEPKALEWFLRWCAYPLQYPGHKMFSSVVLHGIRHGTGKSLLGYTLGRIYGRNFTEIKQDDLHSTFNEWAEGKQLVLGDDVTGSNKRQDADLLKKLITQRELRVNMKYLPSYVVPDCINYFFTSNQPDAFFLEDDDRRFFIHEIEVDPLAEEFYVNYDLWLDTGGAAAVFDYLLQLDLGDFNPAAPALRTEAKTRMIQDVKSDLGVWVNQLVTHPDLILRVGAIKVEGDLFTSKELLQFYDPDGRTGTTANGLARELRRAGVPLACKGHPIKTDHTQGRYYVIRGKATKYQQPQVCIKHVEQREELNVKKLRSRVKSRN